MKKHYLSYIAAFMLILVASVALAACGNGDTTTPPGGASSPTTSGTLFAEADEVRILTLKGPTGMGMANVWNDANNNPESKYKIRIFSGPDFVKAEILLGEYDIAALPTNVAAALYNSGKADLQILAVNTLGVLHIVENGNTVTDIQSLRGKTIHATGQGSTPEYILRHILVQNGIDPDKDVTLDFSYTEHAELAAYAAATENIIAMLPEPQVSSALMNSAQLRVALDLTAEWAKVSESEVMQGCIVVRRAFAEQYPEQLAQFLDEYRASVEYVNEYVDIAAETIANLGILPQAAVAKNAIPRCNITYMEGLEMKEKLSGFLQVLYDADKTSIGGKLPDDAFYYQK